MAAEVFAADGLAASLDEIARRAGLGPGTLYRHFPTKEALIEAVVQHRLAGLVDQAHRLHAAADAGAALLAFIDRLVIDSAPKRDLVDALTAAGVDPGPAVSATAASLHAAVGGLLRRAQEQGAVRADIDAPELMALLSGVILALSGRAGQRPDADRVLAVIRDGLRSRREPVGPEALAGPTGTTGVSIPAGPDRVGAKGTA